MCGEIMNSKSTRAAFNLRLTLAGFLISSSALAVSAQDVIDLGMLVLRSQEDATGPVEETGNAPTVTGSKVPVRLNEVPQSVSVLGRELSDVSTRWTDLRV